MQYMSYTCRYIPNIKHKQLFIITYSFGRDEENVQNLGLKFLTEETTRKTYA